MEVDDAFFNSQQMSQEDLENGSPSNVSTSVPPSPASESHPSSSRPRTTRFEIESPQQSLPSPRPGTSTFQEESSPRQYDFVPLPPLPPISPLPPLQDSSNQIDSDSDVEVARGEQQSRRRRLESSSEDATEDENDGLEEPKRKIKVPSPVWECGAEKAKDGIKCTVCGIVFKTGSSGSTSNISKHILKKHKNKWEGKKLAEMIQKKKVEKEKKDKETAKKKAETKQLKQTSVMNFVKKSAPIDLLKKKKIDKAILKHMIVEKEPFEMVEKHSFREVIYACDPSYVCPSHATVRRNFDNFSVEVAAALKKEINDDLANVPDKVVSITSDHGTSHDNFRTRKNVLTLARCTKDFEIKTDTIAVINCDGSQTGDVIRKDVKLKLDTIGRDDSWYTNWVTDGEKKQINARAPGKHPQVGLETCHTANCVDHTAHLAVEEALEDCVIVKESLDKSHKLVNSMKDSSLMREAFFKVMKSSGEEPLSMLKGTANRWYFKWFEANRVLLLRKHVERFQEEYDAYPTDAVMETEDWRNLTIYVNSLKALVEASNLFEGQNNPTASSVIPFLDQVFAELTSLMTRLPFEDKAFPRSLLFFLKSDRRFPNGYKDVKPFNSLTLLDPRYMDIYYTEDESVKAFDDICGDPIFASVSEDAPPDVSTPPITVPLAANSFAFRRAQLLASKQAPQVVIDRRPASLTQKLSEEKVKFLNLRGTVDLSTNPQIWWREHAQEFPHLAKYYRAHCSFPATSTASERVFNIEGLIVTNYRKSLDPNRAASLVVGKDFLKKRQNEDSFRLCKECLKKQVYTYVINCQLHNS